jgi:hypothetical protein
MSEARPPPEERFLINLQSLIQLIREIIANAKKEKIAVPVEPEMIDFAVLVISGIEPRKIINTFLLRSFNHWDEVKIRNVDFFKSTTKTLFAGVPEENINNFILLYDTIKKDGTKLIDKDYENQIFSFFEAMIRQSICFIHQERRPDTITKKYTVPAYSSIGDSGKISVGKLVDEWKITRLD